MLLSVCMPSCICFRLFGPPTETIWCMVFVIVQNSVAIDTALSTIVSIGLIGLKNTYSRPQSVV